MREVYWERYAAGAQMLRQEDARAFIRRGVDDGKTIKRWSDAMIARVSNYLLGTCADYGLVGKLARSGRRSCPFALSPRSPPFLPTICTLRVSETAACWRMRTGSCSGLQREDVRSELRRLALRARSSCNRRVRSRISDGTTKACRTSWMSSLKADFDELLAAHPPRAGGSGMPASSRSTTSSFIPNRSSR